MVSSNCQFTGNPQPFKAESPSPYTPSSVSIFNVPKFRAGRHTNTLASVISTHFASKSSPRVYRKPFYKIFASAFSPGHGFILCT
jgi:hypothetical protein